MQIKPQIRILGIDDGSTGNEKTLVVGVIFRGGFWIDGLLSCYIKTDGLDATERICEMILKSRHKDLRIVMTDGVTFAGFNTIDIKMIYERTGLPVIAVCRREPDFDDIKKALENLSLKEERWRHIKNAGKVFSLKVKGGRVYFQLCGLEREDAEKIINLTSMHSLLPEPVRVAHIIATGIVRGEASRKP
ncbi:MAG: DUF99 family protein [Candidatus Methanofastidiosia archaeon]